MQVTDSAAFLKLRSGVDGIIPSTKCWTCRAVHGEYPATFRGNNSHESGRL